jgi:hypothetical protein
MKRSKLLSWVIAVSVLLLSGCHTPVYYPPAPKPPVIVTPVPTPPRPPDVIEPTPGPVPSGIVASGVFDSLVIGATEQQVIGVVGLAGAVTGVNQYGFYYWHYKCSMPDGKIKDVELEFKDRVLTNKIVGF